MEKNELPRDFDWVTVRNECSAVKFFDRLRLQAEVNVTTRNGLRSADELQAGMKFGYDSMSGNLFSVFREGNTVLAVRFRLSGGRIEVENSQDGPAFSGTLTLTNEAKCRLRVENENLDEWQVLRRALEPLLFPV